MTPLTAPDAGIRSIADDAGPDPATICNGVHAAFTYEHGVTGVGTTAADALTAGRGVCQDYAHVMLGACRVLGIPGRYVSGHLVGEGGSHAWVEVLRPVPGRGRHWVAEGWDPANNRRTGAGYITVATGRDYADVAPMSGSYDGVGITGTLTVTKHGHSGTWKVIAGARANFRPMAVATGAAAPRMRLRGFRVLALAALVGGCVTALVAPARAQVPPQGCVLAYGAPTVVRVGTGTVGSSCSFVATEVASFVGRGPFRLVDSYTDSSGQTQVRVAIDAQPGQLVQPLTGASTGGDPDQIGIGDHVEADVTGPGGFVTIGNPGAPPASGQHTPPPAPRLAGDTTPVHDPAMTFSDGWYYLFTTGPGIPVRRSRDLVDWQGYGTVFSTSVPPWAPSVVPGAHDTWAPDISFFAGEWHLYYAISVFGTSNSAVGLATNATLDRAKPAYGWHDQGPIIDSHDSRALTGPPTYYNAIDPNVIVDAAGVPHLEFGSFTAGLQIVDLDPATGLPAQPLHPQPLAANVHEFTAVEGGYMIFRDGWYYLFGSYNACCQGSRSDYNVRVGRSRSVYGPFADDVGVPMLAGGGRYVLTSTGAMRGPGGEGVIQRGRTSYIFFHWYDAANNGTPTLGILPLRWAADGWPVAESWGPKAAR